MGKFRVRDFQYEQQAYCAFIVLTLFLNFYLEIIPDVQKKIQEEYKNSFIKTYNSFMKTLDFSVANILPHLPYHSISIFIYVHYFFLTICENNDYFS